MAHLDRYRFLEIHIKQALSFAPIVGIVGQRQVGKTTVVERYTPDQYVTFDDDATLSEAQSNPNLFLERGAKAHNLFAIDECQKVPKIFPALKLFVQKRPRPGQFLLTGSIRFTSRKVIQESLTGRIQTLEMLPMSFSEIHRMPLGDLLKMVRADKQKWESYIENGRSHFNLEKMNKFLKHGGLPGICFIRDQGKINSKFKNQIETLLQRDIRLITETSIPYENLRNLITYIASIQGVSFSYVDAARATQISQITLKKLLYAFENLFLIRRLSSFGDVVSPRFYLEDQGMVTYLHNAIPLEDLRRFLFCQIFNQIHYRYTDVYQLGYFANRGGAHLSFAFKVNKQMFGFDIFEGDKPNLSLLRSAESFITKYPNAVVFLFSSTSKEIQCSGPVKILPLAAVI